MRHRFLPWLFAGVLGVFLWTGLTTEARAQEPAYPLPNQPLNCYFYYPYYYFPSNYWPIFSPKWPEQAGQPCMPPPAYMSYPPFMEPHWRYEWWMPQRFYRGFHFWLDQF